MANDRPWIFLDIGNVIFHDLPLLAKIWRHFYLTLRRAGMKAEFGDIIREREAFLRSNPPERNPREFICRKYGTHIPEAVVREAVDGWRHLYLNSLVMLPSARDAINDLSITWNLGIIANQPPQAREALKQFSLLDQFKVVVISDEVGLHKPDAGIFETALALARAAPRDCVMVGDRIDNDIRPAKRLGMRAIWLDLDYRAIDYRPADEYEGQYMESYFRLNGVDQAVKSDDERPDAVINGMQQLPGAAAGIETQHMPAEAVT